MNTQSAVALERSSARGSPSPHAAPEKRPIELAFDRSLETLWCFRAASASRSVTLNQLREARSLDEKIASGSFGSLQFKILASRQSGTFSLGGDLAFFSDCIVNRDRAALAEYALLAAKAIWANVTNYGKRRVTTIAVVEGEAQGGGFEAALSCSVLVAERGASFGFPEPLFGLFPGMGGELLLATRVDAELATRMVRDSNRYSAEFLYQIGVIDHLVPRGRGVEFARELISITRKNPKGPEANRLEERRQKLAGVQYGDLAQSIELWIEQAFALEPRHLRSMRYIIEMQGRRAR
jgi:DSF synthase